MRAGDLMTTPVVTCHVNDPCSVAAQRMWDFDIGSLGVVNDEGQLTAMITDRDICMAAYTQGHTLEDILVHNAMSKGVVTASAEQTLNEIEQLMAQHQIRRIPIVDRDGRPVGMLSLNDIAIESVQPDTPIKYGPSKISRTLAAICQPRHTKRTAA